MPTLNRKTITAYTDGACEPNPGPGGVGVVLLYKGSRRGLSRGYRLTTNNRMEIQAAILALESLKEPCVVTLYSDSKYLVDSVNQGAVSRWAQSAWKRAKGTRVPNSDLWQRLLALLQLHEVQLHWVAGHAGEAGNERADALSYAALRSRDLLDDEGYIRALELENTAPSKITREGQPCRKCSTPVVKKVPRRSHKQGQQYYFEYYLFCPSCQTMYMVEEAKRYSDSDTDLNRSGT
jgi:ribonuclease HI